MQETINKPCMDKMLCNIYIEKGAFVVCDETGKKIPALTKVALEQDWSDSLASPKNSFSRATFTLICNTHVSKEEMEKYISS